MATSAVALPKLMPTVASTLAMFGAAAPSLITQLETTVPSLSSLKSTYDAQRTAIVFGLAVEEQHYGEMKSRSAEWPQTLLAIQLLLNAGADATRVPILLTALAARDVHPNGSLDGRGWVWAGLHGEWAVTWPHDVDAPPYSYTDGATLLQRQFDEAVTIVRRKVELDISQARQRFDFVHFDHAASDKLEQRVSEQPWAGE